MFGNTIVVSYDEIFPIKNCFVFDTFVTSDDVKFVHVQPEIIFACE